MPGALRGAEAAWRGAGQLPWRELFCGALAAADGHEVTPWMARIYGEVARRGNGAAIGRIADQDGVPDPGARAQLPPARQHVGPDRGERLRRLLRGRAGRSHRRRCPRRRRLVAPVRPGRDGRHRRVSRSSRARRRHAVADAVPQPGVDHGPHPRRPSRQATIRPPPPSPKRQHRSPSACSSSVARSVWPARRSPSRPTARDGLPPSSTRWPGRSSARPGSPATRASPSATASAPRCRRAPTCRRPTPALGRCCPTPCARHTPAPPSGR